MVAELAAMAMFYVFSSRSVLLPGHFVPRIASHGRSHSENRQSWDEGDAEDEVAHCINLVYPLKVLALH